MKKLAALMLLTAVLLLSVAAAAFAQSGQTYTATLDELNGSGASGTATLTLDGDHLNANIESTGLTASQPHAQHIHGMAQAISECPTLAADKDGDGIISVTEGVPDYGPILTSFTTTGDTSAESGTAVDRMPVATANGTLSYSRTLTVPGDVAQNLDDFAIVQHGIDLNGSGKYDGKPSDLDPKLPFEGTVPANCGTIELASATMPDTGGINIVQYGLALGGVLLAAGALLVIGVRRARANS